jgi:F0F1-type ATP synthase membrane subunit b/b'
MDENLPVSAGQREDSFDTAVRGFNRQQVMDYMARNSQLLATLEQHLAVARADAERARVEADQARAEVGRLTREAAESKPVHEEVSGRLSQILRLAAEEADQERATADAEIAALRSESQAESEQLLAQARAQAEADLAEARETAERELAEARSRAESDLTSARDEAERLRAASVQHADELVDEAQRRSGAVNEVSSQRLETLTATHGEAVLRLGQIRDVLADLLDRDAAAGSLAQVVEAVIHPATRPTDAPTVTDTADATELHPAVDSTAEPGAVSPLDADTDYYGASSRGSETEVVEVDGEPSDAAGRHAATSLGVDDDALAEAGSDGPVPAGSPIDESLDLRDRRGVSTRR